MLKIVWEDTPLVKNFILSLFDNAIDKDGIIVDKKTQKPVVDLEGQEISASDLGMIAKGSTIYVKKNLVSLANYFAKFSLENQHNDNS